jgi:hypothetical protein
LAAFSIPVLHRALKSAEWETDLLSSNQLSVNVIIPLIDRNFARSAKPG